MKEIKDSILEEKKMEFQIEKYKKDFINDIKSGLGDEIKKIGSKPDRIKLPLSTRIKIWLRKFML